MIGYQFNNADDIAMELHEQTLARIAEAQAKLTKEFDETWAAIFSLFDRNGLSDEGARFIAKDGYTIQRVKSLVPAAPTLDEAATEAAIRAYAKKTGLDADRLVHSAQDKVVSYEFNQSKLALLLNRKRIPATAVKLKEQKKQFSRKRGPSSKEDLAILALGAEKVNAREEKAG